MVYVLNKDGQPLMPTNRYGKVRHLLKSIRWFSHLKFIFMKGLNKYAKIFDRR